MMAHPDFIAGNTRLRARLAGRVGSDVIHGLVGQPLPTIVERLRGTAYATLLPPGPPEPSEVLRVLDARLREVLRGVGDVYDGVAGEVVGVLLARHDLADTLALLRGARQRQPSGLRVRAVLAVGRVDDTAATEVARASDDGMAADLLSALNLPDPTTAEALREAWNRFAVNADPAEFEWSVAAAAHTRWTRVLVQAGSSARPILDFLRAERDRMNLVTQLAFEAGENPRFLPGGAVGPDVIASEEAIPAVASQHVDWAPALAAYAGDGDIIGLATRIDLAIWQSAIRGLRRGDPLGAAIPLAVVVGAECEARNLRWLLRAADTAGKFDPRPLLVA
jgi:vacuolar-type H+-ATPase subunit C/Vma6